MADSRPACCWSLQQSSAGHLTLALGGEWRLSCHTPSAAEVLQEIPREESVSRLDFDCSGLKGWDTALPAFIAALFGRCREDGITVEPEGLPEKARRLVELAVAASSHEAQARSEAQRATLLERIGGVTLERHASLVEAVTLVGEIARSLPRLLTGRSRMRGDELGRFMQQSGAEAFGIVSLISLLVGLILAFVGAAQLEMFGAQIYVADLVGIGMARDMGAMMTGVIVAGRTGAAFAAQLGTMQVNGEIDALEALGIHTVEFLVLPRMLGVALMMPLLCCYADVMGILGGGLVAVGMFDITPAQYLLQTREAVPLHHFAAGLIKGAVYGVLVGLAGCLRGLQSGRSASAVGEAATSAVVTGIVWIVVWCAILTVIFHEIGL